MFGRRILVLIPHPDDEVVGAAMAIRRAVAGGAPVIGLDLTHGCPPRDARWPWARGKAYDDRIATRRAEAAEAARALGMTRIPDDGAPSRGLRRLLAAAWRRTMEAVETHLVDTVWVPAYEGAHADHDAANALAFALGRKYPELAVWEFAEYNNASGRTRANEFPDARGAETVLRPENDDEFRWKRSLLGIYRSEAFNLGNLGGGEEFRERFRPLPRHDYSRPPHPGRLFYERFHWVPIRVPQIDFTTGAEVSAAITSFLADRAGA